MRTNKVNKQKQRHRKEKKEEKKQHFESVVLSNPLESENEHRVMESQPNVIGNNAFRSQAQLTLMTKSGPHSQIGQTTYI